MEEQRPRIGITMRIDLETERFYLARIPQKEFISSVAENLDGVLLPGSDSDVDPLRYGRDPHPKLGSVHPLKDETDLMILDEIERHAIPLLAICFGMQVLNVSRGGTLIQDINSELQGAIKHEQGAPRNRPSHSVKLLEGSLLEKLAESDSALVNSHHHQAIERVGRELVATAWTSDGLVEALEDPRDERFALAVQWHPEMGWENDLLSQKIFAQFVYATKEFSRTRGLAMRGSENSGSVR
ncbi:MAG: hypothetical protein AUG51_25170 [Acidobacteria bacterium 13_1_20CM_3_53_8]|nr:MAG: hypothetical protein AUG51_25170 [Acidobacteria bacterium 13_1_20CM_3_53_8]